MRENYVKVSFVVFSADRQPEVRKGHTLLGFSILVSYSLSRFSNNSFFLKNVKILNLVAENCLEIEDVLKFESLEDGKGKKTAFGWLEQP